MQRKIHLLWPFLWLLCVWIYVVCSFSSSIEIDIGERNQIFTALLIFHACLYALCLWQTVLIQRWYWLFAVVQNGLIVSMSLVLAPANVIMVSIGLYLALIGIFVSLWRKHEAITFIIISAVISFTLGIIVHGGWAAFHHAILYVAPVILVAGGYILLSLRLARANEQRLTLFNELEETHHRLLRSAARIEELTLANERQRMARELHDTLAQGLAGLTMQLDAVDALLSEDNAGEAQEIVQQAMIRSRATLLDARKAIDDLRNCNSDTRDFYEAVQREILHFTTTTSIPCHTDLTALTTIAPLFHEQVLRVITEGLLNVARHARAQQVEIRTSTQNDLLTLEIRDDGVGFDASYETIPPGHYGLLGLRERARLIKGSLEVESTKGVGTSIHFTFPHKSDKHYEVEGGKQPVVSSIGRSKDYA